MNFIKYVEQKAIYSISICLSMLFFLSATYKVVAAIISMKPDFSGFKIPELMINYQGGFIRRGLMGEIMFQAFQVYPFSVYNFLVYFEISFFILFLSLSYYVFHRLKWIPIMPFAILVGGLTFYRRDFFMLLLAFCVFWSIIKYGKLKKKQNLVLSLSIIILSVLIYEPSFFFTVPISMVLFYLGEDKTKSFLKKIKGILFVFAIPIITMIFVCVAKGTTEQAETIWLSWAPMFEYLKMDQPIMPGAISFLSKSESIIDVAIFHLFQNYGIEVRNNLGFDYQLVLGSLLFFVGMYFLALTIPQKEPSYKLTQKLSSIYLFQFICLLPMFSILSCDFGRTILYVVYSSYYLLFLLKRYDFEISIPYLDNFSNITVTFLQRIPRNICFLLHLLVIFFIPFNICRGIPIFHSLLLDVYGPYVQKNIIFLQNIFGL